MRNIAQLKVNRGRATSGFLAAVMLTSIFLPTGCGKPQVSGKQEQESFATPDDAGNALIDAAKSNDRNKILSIFGPEAQQTVLSGDAVKDKADFEEFAAAYVQMHRWIDLRAGGKMLVTGADNFIFPIPLGQNGAGKWYFDTAAGKDEILARRIGKDELTAIAACEAVTTAEKEYFSQLRGGSRVKQYAQRFISDEGKRDGLYWPVSPGEPSSPLENLRDLAKAMGYTNAGAKPQPFFGYNFRILTEQGDKAKGGAKNYIRDGEMTGGFAVLAYPAEYRNSGIMTFVVGVDGVVYQKDLGEKTSTTAQAITEYDPGEGWAPAI